MKKLPKTIYVRRESEGDSSWLVADFEPDGAEGDLIGVYELKSTGKIRLHAATIEPVKSKP